MFPGACSRGCDGGVARHGAMVSSADSMMASWAGMAVLPVIMVLIELLHLVVDGFFHCDSPVRHDG